MLILFIVFFSSLIFTIALVGIIQIFLKSTVAYRVGIEYALRSRTVTELIGDSINPGLFVGGRVKNGLTDGSYADLRTKLYGSRGRGKLKIFARRNLDGGVKFEKLEFAAGGKTVDILHEIILEKAQGRVGELK